MYSFTVDLVNNDTRTSPTTPVRHFPLSLASVLTAYPQTSPNAPESSEKQKKNKDFPPCPSSEMGMRTTIDLTTRRWKSPV